MISSSSPLKATQNLKVKIDSKSSYDPSIGQKKYDGQTPTDDEIEIEDIENQHDNSSYDDHSYPTTPIITENLSYTLTPNTHNNNNNKTSSIPSIPPITPITPNNNDNNHLHPKQTKTSSHPQFKNNYSNSLSSKYYHHSNQNSNSSQNSNQFPDTPHNGSDDILYELDEIDEKKQTKVDKKINNKKSRSPSSRSNTNTNTKRKKKKTKKFSLMDTDIQELNKKDTLDGTLKKYGYKRMKKIANTLQGTTFIAEDISSSSSITTKEQTPSELVIKTTSKELYNKGITVTKEGKAFNIQEDIVKEAKMMRLFMKNNPPASLIGFIDFFEDSDNYYLVMEHGGTDFFDFVVKCHELINENKLSMKEWRKQCKFIFAQMIQFIKWLHETMNYCHLDVSLENLLISKMAYFDETNGKLNKCYVKFIDFGLAEKFDLNKNPNWECTKYVGKTHYKAPKVYNKKEIFHANKADIWSLGVALFMMVIGAPPYNRPIIRDPGFRFIAEKKMTKLLYSWGRIKYVTPNLYDLMERMLTLDESKRITLEEIVTHPWLKIYFPEENAPKITSLPSQSNNKDKNKDNNNDKNKSEDKDKIKINLKTKGNHMELLKSPGCMQKHQMSLPKSPSFSQSAYSISNTELSATYSQINHGGAALNIMLPQQAVSRSSITSPQQNPYSIIPQTRTSRVRSKSRTRTRTRTRTNSGYNHSPLPTSPHSIPRKASTSYGYKSPNNNRRSIGYKSPLSPPINNNNNNNNTPTPIIESHTSKHDYKQYFAQVVDDEESLKKLRNGKSHKNKKKKQRYNNNNQQIKLENEKEKEKKKNGKKFFKLSSLSIFGSSKKK